jgi:hypothetical protein
MIDWLLLAVAAVGHVPQAKMLDPGVISTTANEFGGAISPDASELWFSSGVPPYYMEAIFVSRRLPSGHWGPRHLAPFSGRWHDFDPVLSPDGKRILFISYRPTRLGEVKRDYDIWYADRQPGGTWSPARRFAPPVNSVPDANGQGGREEFASVAADGTIYFAGDPRESASGAVSVGGMGMGTGMAIYRVPFINGHYEKPERLPDTINFWGVVGEPVIAPDQSYLLFAAFGAPGGYGNWDIYFARRGPDGQWQKPQNLGPGVNTAERDYSARLAPDGHTLLFTSERYFGSGGRHLDFATIRRGMTSLLNGQGNIYTIDLRTLGVDPRKG